MKQETVRRTVKRSEDKQLTARLWRFERERTRGFRVVAGVDEAGRGCLAGPVFAAAVVLSDDVADWIGVMDSKLLSRSARQRTYARIVDGALSVSVGVATVQEIDQYNILQASLLAMTRALEGLSMRPDIALIDGPHAPRAAASGMRMDPVVDGDAQCISIAAASIIAKVERDRWMEQVALAYPQYGFEHHVGYGTAEHVQALREHGPCEHHRTTFAPVRRLFQADLGIDG